MLLKDKIYDYFRFDLKIDDSTTNSEFYSEFKYHFLNVAASLCIFVTFFACLTQTNTNLMNQLVTVILFTALVISKILLRYKKDHIAAYVLSLTIVISTSMNSVYDETFATRFLWWFLFPPLILGIYSSLKQTIVIILANLICFSGTFFYLAQLETEKNRLVNLAFGNDYYLDLFSEYLAIYFATSIFIGTFKYIYEHLSESMINSKKIQLEHNKLSSIADIAAGMAHEVNNPLSVVKLSVDFLRKKIASNSISEEQIIKRLDMIDESIERISYLTHESVSLTKFTSTEKREVNLKEIVELIVSREQVEKVQLDIPEDCIVTIASLEVQKILGHLVSNAQDAVEGLVNPEIKISAQKRRDSITISVEDNGIGIDDKNLIKLFNPFFTTKQSGKKLGLGLCLSHAISSSLGGTLKYSRVNNKTSFVLSIPYID